MDNSKDTATNTETENLDFNFIALEDIKKSPLRLKRMAAVFTMRTEQNMSWPDIAKALNISIPTAFSDYTNVCEKFYEQNSENLQLIIKKELARLETQYQAYVDSALAGNHESEEVLNKIIKQKIKLLGLDKFAQNKLLQTEDTNSHEITINYVGGNGWRTGNMQGKSLAAPAPSNDLENVNTDRW